MQFIFRSERRKELLLPNCLLDDSSEVALHGGRISSYMMVTFAKIAEKMKSTAIQY